MSTHLIHIRLSNLELTALADRYVQRHGGDGPTKLHLLQGCQDVLNPERRRVKLPWSIINAIIPFIKESHARGVEHESTNRLRETGVLGDMSNGRVDFYADQEHTLQNEVVASAPVIATISPLLMPRVKSRPISPAPVSDVRELTSDLIEINRLVLHLKAADPSLLSMAGELDAKRIQSLVIQASNGLVFFEEIAALARRL